MISVEAKRAAIAALENKFGEVTAQDLVDAARSPDHPLHDAFEWDVDKAAEQHWLNTARHIIAEVRVAVRIQERVVRRVCYVRDPRNSGRAPGYVALPKAARDRDLARQIVEQELTRIESAVTRARDIADVLDLTEDLEELLEVTLEVKEKVVEKPAAKPAAKPKRSGKRDSERPRA